METLKGSLREPVPYLPHSPIICNLINKHVSQQVSMHTHIILCERFCLSFECRLFHAKDLLSLDWQKAKKENSLIQSHQFCAWNIARIRPCIAFAFSNNGPVLIGKIKFMPLRRFPYGNNCFLLK